MKKTVITVIAIFALLLLFFAGMLFQGTFAFGTNHGKHIDMKKNIVITAHRGGAGYAPENTLQAISRSLQAGAGSIETDIHMSADGELIVCHDRRVNRTTDGKGAIGRMTGDALRGLTVLDRNGKATGEHLPRLEEVLELIGGRAELLLEIKRTGNDNPGIEKAAVEMLERHNAVSWTVIQSFNDEVLENVHSIAPSVRLEKLLFCKIGGLPVIYDGTFTRFSLEKYSYIESFNFFFRGLSRTFAEYLHENGKSVRLWTLKSPEQIPDYDFEGIITDYPDLFMEHFASLDEQ